MYKIVIDIKTLYKEFFCKNLVLPILGQMHAEKKRYFNLYRRKKKFWLEQMEDNYIASTAQAGKFSSFYINLFTFSYQHEFVLGRI